MDIPADHLNTNLPAMTSSHPVLIVGSGIGGLVLAHALRNKRIPYRIFERDPHLNHRLQGYRLHLRKDGEDALMSCLTPKTREKLKQASPAYRGPGGVGVLCDPHTGEPDVELLARMKKMIGDSHKPFNVDRTTLRMILAEDIGVEFGKNFRDYAIDNDGVTINFKDNTSASGCLLVGADGLRSPIRAQLLPEYSLLDTEGRWVWGKSELTPELRPKLKYGIAEGILGARDRTNASSPISLLAESIVFGRSRSNALHDRLPADYIYWGLQFSTKTAGVDDATFGALDSAGAVKLVQTLTANWQSDIRAIFDHTTPGTSSAHFVTCGDPEVPPFDSQGRVTLIGDAIHSMPPTAGMGAACAIQDAKWLADIIEERGVSVDSLNAYQEKMRSNGIKAIASAEPRLAETYGGAASFAEMKRIKAAP